MNTYCHGTMESLRSDMIGTFSAATKEEGLEFFDKLLEGFNPDSPEWDSKLEEFIESQRANNNYYAWDTHQVEVPDLKMPNIIVTVVGGLVSDVTSDSKCQVAVVDYDTDGTSNEISKIDDDDVLIDLWELDPSRTGGFSLPLYSQVFPETYKPKEGSSEESND
jgi:hypothetical protein